MEDKKKFNVIDVLIILLVAVVIVVGAFVVRQAMNGSDGETKMIVVEVTERKKSFCDILKKDDLAYDGVENVKLGKVVDFEVKPAQIDSTSSSDGTIKRTTIPERYDILLSLEIPQDTEIQVGKQLWIETSLYKCDGYVIKVDDGGKAAEKNK